MKKGKFEQELLEVLKKFGYKTEGIKNITIYCDINEIPEIQIEYFLI